MHADERLSHLQQLYVANELFSLSAALIYRRFGSFHPAIWLTIVAYETSSLGRILLSS